MNKSALIVVDMQNDFVEGGTLPVHGGLDLATAISLCIEEEPTDVLVTTQDWHVDVPEHFAKWGEHCVAHTHGAELVPSIADSVQVMISAGQPYLPVHKGRYDDGYSGFEHADGIFRSPLTLWLKKHNVDRVTIVGVATEACVRSTAIDARRAGFHTTVIKELVAGLDKDLTRQAYEDMELAGVEFHSWNERV